MNSHVDSHIAGGEAAASTAGQETGGTWAADSARSTMSAGMPSTMGYLRLHAVQMRRKSSMRRSPWQAGQARWARTDASNSSWVAVMACSD